MARSQSRYCVSIPRETYEALARLRERHRISVAQLVAQAAWALIRGAIQIAPARSPYLLGLETSALRALLVDAKARAAWEAHASEGTCATCSERDLVAPAPIERGGPEYPTCWECSRPAEQPSARWRWRRRMRA